MFFLMFLFFLLMQEFHIFFSEKQEWREANLVKVVISFINPIPAFYNFCFLFTPPYSLYILLYISTTVNIYFLQFLSILALKLLCLKQAIHHFICHNTQLFMYSIADKQWPTFHWGLDKSFGSSRNDETGKSSPFLLCFHDLKSTDSK